jgi:hypothetical protein
LINNSQTAERLTVRRVRFRSCVADQVRRNRKAIGAGHQAGQMAQMATTPAMWFRGDVAERRTCAAIPTLLWPRCRPLQTGGGNAAGVGAILQPAVDG